MGYPKPGDPPPEPVMGSGFPGSGMVHGGGADAVDKIANSLASCERWADQFSRGIVADIEEVNRQKGYTAEIVGGDADAIGTLDKIRDALASAAFLTGLLAQRYNESKNAINAVKGG